MGLDRFAHALPRAPRGVRPLGRGAAARGGGQGRVSPDEDRPPHVGRKMLLRAGGATLLIMCLTATAVAVAVIREVQDITAPIREGRATIEIPELDRADAGGARTFMILGS